MSRKEALYNALISARESVLDVMKCSRDDGDKLVSLEVLKEIANIEPLDREKLSNVEGVDRTIMRKNAHWIMKTIREFQNMYEINQHLDSYPDLTEGN